MSLSTESVCQCDIRICSGARTGSCTTTIHIVARPAPRRSSITLPRTVFLIVHVFGDSAYFVTTDSGTEEVISASHSGLAVLVSKNVLATAGKDFGSQESYRLHASPGFSVHHGIEINRHESALVMLVDNLIHPFHSSNHGGKTRCGQRQKHSVS